jgi:acyl-coenzyme A thioesterase PaaI-like protein
MPTQEQLVRIRERAHPLCVLCGSEHGFGLRLRFVLNEDGGVEARFHCTDSFQGYEGMLSGGVASSILDCAMTNCLFAYGIAAVTAKMAMRFRKPVPIDTTVTVRARIEDSRKPLHVVRSELVRGGEVVCEATGKFLEMSGVPQREE